MVAEILIAAMTGTLVAMMPRAPAGLGWPPLIDKPAAGLPDAKGCPRVCHDR